jgi:fatty-acyl-CoA synthase
MTVSSTLYGRFWTVAQSRPDAPALTFVTAGGRERITYTFTELFSRVTDLADRFAAARLDRAAPLGLLLRSQESQVLHYLAALHADLVPAILTPPNRKLHAQYYQDTMHVVLSRCGFGAVVTDLDGLEVPTRRLEAYTAVGEPALGPRSSASTDTCFDVPFLQFSSGTTGIKRAVLVPERAVIDQLDVYASAIGLNDDDVLLNWLPLYHDMGFIACLNMPLAYGVHTVMLDPIDWVSDPAMYLRAVTEYRATLSWHPNFAYNLMAQRIREPSLAGVELSSLRGLVNCSEPVTDESQQAFLDRYNAYKLAPDVFKGCYAMAETTFALTHGEPDDVAATDFKGPEASSHVEGRKAYVSVGRPLDGVELRIVDPTAHADLPDRRIGEVWVRSPFNFIGYLRDHEANERAFVDGWYRTGDLGYTVNGALYIAGRLKDVMIVGGVNVFPQEIEEVVSEVDGVHPGRVASFSTFDERLQTERIVILAESDQTGTGQEGSVVQRTRQMVLAAFQIANFEVHLVSPGWLVKSSSGKMARSANRDRWLRR